MRVLFLTEGRRVPSTRFRVLQLVPWLERLGFDCTVRHCSPGKYLVSRKRGVAGLYDLLTATTRWLQIRDAARFDAVFLQRDLNRWRSPRLERLLLCRNPRLVFDLDDAQWLESSAEKIRWIAAHAAALVVGNPTLAEFFAPLSSEILPTVVDAARYPLKEHEDRRPLIVGWTGSRFNYPFFDGFRPVLEDLLEPGRVEMEIISEGGEVAELVGLPVRVVRWSPATELESLARFDIGVMPLPDNELTRHKCGLKLVQYGAAGIPSVASPIGANRDIVIDGETGFLCRDVGDWRTALLRLTDSVELRRRMGAAGRTRVEAHYDAPRIAAQLAVILRRVAGGN